MTASGRGVADRAPGSLVQVVERGSVADVGGEGTERSGEPARRVPLHGGQPDLVDPPVVGGVGGGISVVFLGADDEVRIPLVARHEAVLVAHVLVRADVAVSLGIEDAVDVDPKPAVRLPSRHGDVVPHVVRHDHRPADRVPRGAGAHAEGDSTSRERHAEVAVGAGIVDVPVEEDVAEDPAVVGVAVDGGGGIVAVLGPHPPLQGEVGRANVSRFGGVVDLDRDAVDAALAVAEEAERRGRRRSREQETEPGDQQEDDRGPSGPGPRGFGLPMRVVRAVRLLMSSTGSRKSWHGPSGQPGFKRLSHILRAPVGETARNARRFWPTCSAASANGPPAQAIRCPWPRNPMQQACQGRRP